MTHTGPVVTLEVAKQGAIFNGVSDLLNKPSPTMQRGMVEWFFFISIQSYMKMFVFITTNEITYFKI